MSISFQCIKCGKKYRLDNKLSGRHAKCACGFVMVIPVPESSNSHSAVNVQTTKSNGHTPLTTEHKSASNIDRTEKIGNSKFIKAPMDINYREPISWYLILTVSFEIILALFCFITFILGFVVAHKTIDEGIRQRHLYGFSYSNLPVGYVTFAMMFYFISGLISILLVVGFLKRSRLARQYFRIIAMIGFVVLGVPLVLALIFGIPNLLVLRRIIPYFVSMVIWLLLLLSVDTKRSLRFFGLYCPRCGSYKIRAADFLYRKIRCKNCATVIEPWSG